MKERPIVAIVGRPNVGKSTLFNRISQTRSAIVSEIAGVTRDRNYIETDWCGVEFFLIDTGGITYGGSHTLDDLIKDQAMLAIEEADVILFAVDSRTGLMDEDKDIAKIIRRSQKPSILVVNKVDDPSKLDEYSEFTSLGFKEMCLISATHGLGTGDMLDKVVKAITAVRPDLIERRGEGELEPEELDNLPALEDSEAHEDTSDAQLTDTSATTESDHIPQIAIIGRPNVGKSSLVNKVIGQERAVISEIPGTTRDSIDSRYEYHGKPYVIIDTAGLRRKTKVTEDLEFYSVLRTIRAVERADIVVLLVDISGGVAEQEQKIAELALKRGKCMVIACNKADLIDDARYKAEFLPRLARKLHFLSYVPVVKISALTGKGLNKLLSTVNAVYAEHSKRIPTNKLNNVLIDVKSSGKIPTKKGRAANIKFATQTGIRPPTFVYFLGDPKTATENTKRFLERKLRENFGFEGTPIKQFFRKK